MWVISKRRDRVGGGTDDRMEELKRGRVSSRIGIRLEMR